MSAIEVSPDDNSTTIAYVEWLRKGQKADPEPDYNREHEMPIQSLQRLARKMEAEPDIVKRIEVIDKMIANWKLNNVYPNFIRLIEPSDSLARVDTEESFEDNFVEFKSLGSLPKPEWLIYDVLPTQGVNFIYGRPGCGKTFVGIGMACSVAMDVENDNDVIQALDEQAYADALNWCGRVTKHGHVIYIAAEDIDEVAQRALAWANHHRVEDLPNLHFFKCPLRLAKDTPQFIEAINKRYPDTNIALIVVDTLAMCSMGIDENSKKEFDAVIASLETLWRTYRCCVGVIHHAGKNGEMRGTSSMDAVAYSMIQVSEEDEHITMKSIKKRRGKKFEDIHLDRVIIETGELDSTGEPTTTCVIVKADWKAGQDATKLTKLQKEILEHATNLGSKDVPRAELMKACMIDKSGERSFMNAILALLRKGLMSMNKIKQRTTYSIIPCKGEGEE